MIKRPALSPRWRPLVAALTSIEFVLSCMGLAMALIVVGTLAQVDLGTFAAQDRYFNSYWLWARTGLGFSLPVFPGGLTVGALWMASLAATLAYRFKYSWKNAGLLISHLGLGLLLLGQFLTQTFAQESQMAIRVGQTLNYVEDTRHTELAVVASSDPGWDDVVSVPYAKFSRPGVLRTPLLPFAIEIKRFFANARLGMAGPGQPAAATQGVGARISIEEAPVKAADDETNAVSAVVEILEDGRSLGTWLLSSGLGAPQSVRAAGKDYELSLRPLRRYLPFALTLKEFKHDVYPGTDIPKNFSSLVELGHFETGERRQDLIYMNSPLRYEGLTFYQASFGEDDKLSVLQVVRNPAWLTPYVSCFMVLFGLAVHFLRSLAAARKRA